MPSVYKTSSDQDERRWTVDSTHEYPDTLQYKRIDHARVALPRGRRALVAVVDGGGSFLGLLH